MSPDSAAGLAL